MKLCWILAIESHKCSCRILINHANVFWKGFLVYQKEFSLYRTCQNQVEIWMNIQKSLKMVCHPLPRFFLQNSFNEFGFRVLHHDILHPLNVVIFCAVIINSWCIFGLFNLTKLIDITIFIIVVIGLKIKELLKLIELWLHVVLELNLFWLLFFLNRLLNHLN